MQRRPTCWRVLLGDLSFDVGLQLDNHHPLDAGRRLGYPQASACRMALEEKDRELQEVPPSEDKWMGADGADSGTSTGNVAAPSHTGTHGFLAR